MFFRRRDRAPDEPPQPPSTRGQRLKSLKMVPAAPIEPPPPPPPRLLNTFNAVATEDGSELFIHWPCRNTEWWHPINGPINDQGCDACESAPDGGWRRLYVRRISEAL